MTSLKLITFLMFVIAASIQGVKVVFCSECNHSKKVWTNQNSVNEEEQTWMFDTDYTMTGPYQEPYREYETITKSQTENETIHYLLA